MSWDMCIQTVRLSMFHNFHLFYVMNNRLQKIHKRVLFLKFFWSNHRNHINFSRFIHCTFLNHNNKISNYINKNFWLLKYTLMAHIKIINTINLILKISLAICNIYKCNKNNVNFLSSFFFMIGTFKYLLHYPYLTSLLFKNFEVLSLI